MADFLDLNSRASKLQKEQQKRREAAKLRIKRERATKEAASRDQAKFEEHNRQRKLEQLRKEEEERRRVEAEQVRTGGISFRETLTPVCAAGEGDKVLLPPSALETLSSQDAVGMGTMLFEISRGARQEGAAEGEVAGSGESKVTHAGVLEFVAAEGTIGLPRKVIISLLGPREVESSMREGEPEEESMLETLGSVTVKYVRLAKAKFARVVPETVGLSQVSELRAMLEDNLRNHATLTVGDRLSVWQRGKEFRLKVAELRPEPHVTLIDTDMEVELDLPKEAKEKLEAKNAEDRARTLRAYMPPPPPTSTPVAGTGVTTGGTPAGRTLSPVAPAVSGRRSMDVESDSDSDEDSGQSGEIFEPEKHRLAKLQGLPEEPSRDEEGVFVCQMRSPQGRFARRFRHADSLDLLLDFAEAHGGIPGHYRIVIQFPRRFLTREDASAGMTLRDAGLTSKQEAVILEKF